MDHVRLVSWCSATGPAVSGRTSWNEIIDQPLYCNPLNRVLCTVYDLSSSQTGSTRQPCFSFRELKEPKGVQPAPAWIMTSGATPCWLCTCRSIWRSVKFGPVQGPSVCAQMNPPGSGQNRGKQVCYNHNTEFVWNRNGLERMGNGH